MSIIHGIYGILIICLVLQQILITVLIVGLSRRRKSKARLRALNRHFLKTQEEERKRIARELHDDFGQRLALLKIGIEMAIRENLFPGCEAGHSMLQRVVSEIDELNIDIQHLSRTLHSAKLQYLGLRSALKGLCEQVGQQHVLTIELQANDTPEVASREVELCFYRVAQEAVHNAVKHSGADQVAITLSQCGATLQMEITDNGKGFNQAAALRGMGLISMRERMATIGGELKIKSAPGDGTHLLVRAPLAHAA